MRYEPEEKLIEKVQSGERYCHRKGLDPGLEESATAFMEMRNALLDEALENGNA